MNIKNVKIIERSHNVVMVRGKGELGAGWKVAKGSKI